MKRKWSELPDRAWVSQFWAQYSTLPESLKKVFFNMAQYVAKENENGGTTLNGSFPRIMKSAGGNCKTPVL